MKKYKYIAGIVLGMVAVVLCSCNDLLDGKDNPYEGTTREHILEEAAHVAVTSLRTIEHLLKQKEQDGNEW